MKITKFFFLCTSVFVLNSFYSCKSCNKDKDQEKSLKTSIDEAVDSIQGGMDSFVEKGKELTGKAGEGLKRGTQELENYKSKVNKWNNNLKTSIKSKEAKKLAERYCELLINVAEKEEVNLQSSKDKVEKAKIEKKIEDLRSELSNLDKELKALYKKLPEVEVKNIQNFIEEFKN